MEFDHLTYQRDRYAERKAKYIALLGSCCTICSSEEDLEFDHIDPSSKSFEISLMLSKYSGSAIEAELSKCQLLCNHCHQAKTAKEHSQRTPWNAGSGKMHGSYYGVYTLKCSCSQCLEYRNKRLAKRKSSLSSSAD